MQSSGAGFTLIELLVTVSIFVIISSLALASYPQFSQRMALTRTSQEIALALRKAQSLSQSVKAVEFGPSFTYPSYGIRFDLSAPNGNKEFFMFADTDEGNDYDIGEPIVETFYIPSSPIIANLCTAEETLPPGNCSFTVIDIIYARPGATSQYPVIIVGGGGASDAEIKVSNPSGTMIKTIVAWTTGQIAVK